MTLHLLLCPRHLRLIGFLCLGACARNTTALLAQGTSGCRPTDTVQYPAHLEYLKTIATATDSVSAATRDSFQLQLTTASKVGLVTKNTTCVTAANAVNTAAGTPGRVRQVWVYTLGSSYAVEDPSIPYNEEGGYPFYLFDQKWKPKRVLIY